jgi:hypothetical protein
LLPLGVVRLVEQQPAQVETSAGWAKSAKAAAFVEQQPAN